MGRNSGTGTLADAVVGTRGMVAVRNAGAPLPPSLAGMGLRAGAEIEVVARGPFGGPVLIEVRQTGTRVAVGRALAGRLAGARSGKAAEGRTALLLATAVCALVVTAPAPSRADEGTARIRDNLFLLEEAYNQEPGVAQHIQLFEYAPENHTWLYSFTDEWPVPTDLNQLSVTVPVVGLGADAADEVAVGDILLNSRIQAVGLGGTSWISLAPRVSLVLPTGDVGRGTGRGALGLQFNVPLSMEVGSWFVVHLNAGLTVAPAASPPGGGSETALDANAGLGLVWQPLPWFNVLVETVYLMTEDLATPSGDRFEHSLIVNPGVRFAIDATPSFQIVPGVSVPVTVWPDDPVEVAILGYLSLEHGVW